MIISNLLAHCCIFFAFVGAEEKFSIEKLNSNHSKDEMEKEVDDLFGDNDKQFYARNLQQLRLVSSRRFHQR